MLRDAHPVEAGVQTIGGAAWRSDVRRIAYGPDTLDISAHFTLERGRATSAGVALAFDVGNWRAESYVLVPGIVYDGNRFRVYPASYPPFIQEPAWKHSPMPITISNITRLEQGGRRGKIELLTGNAATPMMSFYDPSAKRGVILVTDQASRFGNHGLIIEEDPSTGRVRFVVSAPGVREKRYVIADFVDSDDHGATFVAGDTVTLRVRQVSFAAPTLLDFLDRVWSERKSLSGPTRYRHRAPFSAIAATILAHHDATKWSEARGYITQEHRGVKPWAGIIQTGWGGVPTLTQPYCLRPTPERLRRVAGTWDRLVRLQAPNGLLYAKWNEQMLGDNHREIERPNQVLTRRFGEALYYGFHNLVTLERGGHGDAIKPEWVAMLRRLSDALVALWTTEGDWGQFVDVVAGRIDVPGSSAGVVCATGLALASRYFREPRYLKVAEAAARFYHDRDLARGYSGGGPREALQAPDSESTHCFVDLFTVLHELTGKPIYLKRARQAAAMFATWIISYDYRFPAGSRMAMVHAGVTGACLANSQNNHGAPCLWLHSGDFLLKLYRLTEDPRLAELSRDIVHNCVQFVTTSENPLIPDAVPGSVSERVQISDWEGADTIGSRLHPGDSRLEWEVGILLTILHNPGIYLRTDSGALLVHDHVDARLLRHGRAGALLEIANPTREDASVTILAEDAARAARPLDSFAYVGWPSVEIPAGATRRFTVSAEGNITAAD